MKKLTLFIVTLHIFVFTARAQEDDIAGYFDDGGVAEASRLVKAGIDPLNGEIAFIYEHRLTTHISVEWGGGPVFLKRQAALYDDIQHTSAFGFNVWANLRIYLKGYYERFYVGFQPRLNLLDEKLYTDIVFFNCGYQRPITGRIVLDINTGMGVRSYKEDVVIIGNVEYDFGRNSAFIVPVQLKLGYAF